MAGFEVTPEGHVPIPLCEEDGVPPFADVESATGPKLLNDFDQKRVGSRGKNRIATSIHFVIGKDMEFRAAVGAFSQAFDQLVGIPDASPS
jgi:hypothetical protein